VILLGGYGLLFLVVEFLCDFVYVLGGKSVFLTCGFPLGLFRC
jgi:hypothetical protein